MCSQWPNMGQLNIEIDHNNNTLNSIAKIRLHSAHMLSCFSCVQLFSTLWTVAHKAPLSMEFSRQEYWSGQSFPYPGDLPNPSIAPTSLTSPALAGRFFTISSTWETIAQMLLLLLSRFSRVRLCATPQTAAHQAPPSLGFSRQEYWSGLPFPSPMHESEK